MILATTQELNTIITMREQKRPWEVIAQNVPFTLSQLKVIRKHQLKVLRPDLVLNIGPAKGENRYTDRTPITSIDTWEAFDDYCRDYGNWGGNPLVMDYASERRAINALRKMGLITLMIDAGHRWISFTEAGEAMAAERGFTLIA